GELDVERGLRGHEGGAEFTDWLERVAQDHFAIAGSHRLAPRRIRLPFLINRNAFAEPARHLIAGYAQGNHMTKLMPEHGFPIRFMMACLGRRAVGGDDVPETNSQVTRIV